MIDDATADDVDAIEGVLGAVGGKYGVRILAAAERPTSAQELSDELGVPIATCYRRIEELEAADLLECVGSETSTRGRQTKVYRRTVDALDLDLRGEAPALAVERRAEPHDSLRDRRDG